MPKSNGSDGGSEDWKTSNADEGPGEEDGEAEDEESDQGEGKEGAAEQASAKYSPPAATPGAVATDASRSDDAAFWGFKGYFSTKSGIWGTIQPQGYAYSPSTAAQPGESSAASRGRFNESFINWFISKEEHPPSTLKMTKVELPKGTRLLDLPDASFWGKLSMRKTKTKTKMTPREPTKRSSPESE